MSNWNRWTDGCRAGRSGSIGEEETEELFPSPPVLLFLSFPPIVVVGGFVVVLRVVVAISATSVADGVDGVVEEVPQSSFTVKSGRD